MTYLAHTAYLYSQEDLTQESVINGRKNWNIPKHLAKFNVLDQPDGAVAFSVSLPEATAPFFDAILRPAPYFGRLHFPYNSNVTGPYLTLYQPPLPAGTEDYAVGTEKWTKFKPLFKSKSSLSRISGRLLGDGKAFPQVDPHTVGMYLEDLDMTFGEADFMEGPP